MKRLMVWGLALTALGVGLVGCGSEEDASASEFCTGYIDLTAGDPEPAAIRKVAATAPGKAKTALRAIADGAEKDGEDYFDGPEFGKNFKAAGEVAADECADDSISVSAKEYEFTGVPKSIDAGVLAVDFANKGTEFHEFTVFRKKEGVSKSFLEILKLDEDEAKKFLEEKGGTFAAPDEDAPGLFSLEEPGDYVAVCSIPVGATPESTEEPTGPPHFTKGMRAEFTIE
jgi:hypothetical protein